MKEFINKNINIILIVLVVLLFLKGCNDSRNLNEINDSIESIKKNTFTKEEIRKELKISGLEAEKRMIQSTDRKIIDVQRQSEIEKEISTERNSK